MIGIAIGTPEAARTPSRLRIVIEMAAVTTAEPMIPNIRNGLEVKHLLDAIPADNFRLRQYKTKRNAKQEVEYVQRCCAPNLGFAHIAPPSRSGNSSQDANRPPAKKPTTAISEGNSKFARPLMAWPDVHPPAYAEPNPTS